MKRFLLTLLCTALTTLSFGQKDIAVELTSPADGDILYAGQQFNYSFTVTNLGPDDLVADDTVAFVIILDGQLASQQIYILPMNTTPVPVNGTIDFTTPLTFNQGDNQIHDLCVGVLLSDSDSTQTDFVSEVDMTNNSDCSSVTISSGTIGVDGVPELAELQNEVSISPNPASTEVNFEVSEGAEEVTIYDLNGRVVITNTIQGTEKTIDISDLENGVYFYAVKFENGEVKKERFVVSK